MDFDSRCNEFCRLAQIYRINPTRIWKYSNWNPDNDNISGEKRDEYYQKLLIQIRCDRAYDKLFDAKEIADGIEFTQFKAYVKKVADKPVKMSILNFAEIISALTRETKKVIEAHTDHIADLKKENERLEEENAKIFEKCVEIKKENDKLLEDQAELKRENAKLLADSHKLAEICEIIKE